MIAGNKSLCIKKLRQVFYFLIKIGSMFLLCIYTFKISELEGFSVYKGKVTLVGDKLKLFKKD